MAASPIIRLTTVAFAAVLFLSGCQSDEERATEFMESGQELVLAGDYPRAIIQFRNVLRIDQDHGPARAAMAQALLRQGDLVGAQQEFTALAERFPDEMPWRRALGQIALVKADWVTLERQADEATKIEPQNADTTILQLAVAYRKASVEGDAARQELIAHEARKMLAASPADPILLRLVVEHLAGGDSPADAIPVLDAALAIDAHVPELQILRIRLLAEANQIEAAEERLLGLATLYPQDSQIAGMLASRYLSKGDVAAAEAVLRALVDGAPRTDTSLRVSLVRFLQTMHGDEAALAELAKLTDEVSDKPAGALYAAMARSIRFDAGDEDNVVADLEALVDGIENRTEGFQIRVLMARVEDKLGNRDKARAAVDSILTQDPGNLPALKLRAEWLIEMEQPKPAIVALRTAIAQAPRDVELMSLLAAAHTMDGENGLAMEQLAAATEASGHAAAEADRYARALVKAGRPGVAQRVMEAALANDPQNARIVTALAGLYVEQANWPRARAMLATLARLDTQEARDAHAPLKAAILEGEGDRAAGLRMLDDLTAKADGDYRAATLVVQSLVRRGDLPVARAYLNHALSNAPDVPELRLLDATLRRQEGDIAGAEAILREFVAAGTFDLTVRELFILLMGQGQRAEAEEILAAGLARFPMSRDLRLIESNRLEANGDPLGAIAILDVLQREDPTDLLVTNNLASLISVHSEDPAELDRAARMMTGLKSDAVPAIADTIGWLAYRRGDVVRALPLMERASRGLPFDLAVQLRLGQVYAASGRLEEARDVFEHVAGEDHPLAIEATARLAELPAGSAR